MSFLEVLENEMKNNIVRYEGTKEFKAHKFQDIFCNGGKPKVLQVPRDRNKDILINNDNWFVFEKFYGTSEEKSLVELIDKMISIISNRYDKNEIYLIRNERHFKIFTFEDGRAFEPDFVLFTKNLENNLYYQIFIEPKGTHLALKDKWKEDFLQEIKNDFKDKVIEFENKEYKIIGLQFYDKAHENYFGDELKEVLSLKT